MRKSDLKFKYSRLSIISAQLEIETRVRLYCGRFAPGMARSLFEFRNFTHPRAGRQYLPVCGDPPKATYRSLARSVVASLQVWHEPF